MRRFLYSFALFLPLLACGAPADDADVGESTSNLGADPSIPALPAPGGTGDLAPWGGPDPARWRTEAILGNAVGIAMNAAWSRTDVKDVVVAVPTKIWSSGFFEFGDGQSNSRVELEHWRNTP